MDSWRKFLALSWSDRWLLLCSMVALPLAACVVRCLGFGRCRALVEQTLPESSNSAPTAADVDEARKIARLVRIAATRNVYMANCLQRSIVLWWLLRSRRVPCEIRIGCRAGDQRLEAHAWVECAGQVIGDRADVREQFAPFISNQDEVLVRNLQ